MPRIQFESDVHKPMFWDEDYFSAEVLVGTRFPTRLFNFICCINQPVEYTKRTIQFIGSAPNEPLGRRLESIEDWIELTTGTQTEMIDLYPEIKPHNVALYKNFTLPRYAKTQVEVVKKTFGL